MKMNSIILLFVSFLYGNQNCDDEFFINLMDDIDSSFVLKDTIIDCNLIEIKKNYYHEVGFPIIEGTNQAALSCSYDEIQSRIGVLKMLSKPITCNLCGIAENKKIYDTMNYEKNEQGQVVKNLIRNGIVIEQTIFCDEAKEQKKNFVMDTIVNDTMFRFYLNSFFKDGVLTKRDVRVDTILLKSTDKTKKYK